MPRHTASGSRRDMIRITTYVARINSLSQTGEKVLILMPDSTASRAFSKWTGPAIVVEVLSPYSYVVGVAGTRRHFHANKSHKFHVRLESVVYDSSSYGNTCAVVYESDSDFGDIDVIALSTEALDPISPSQMIDRNSIESFGQRATGRLVGGFASVPGVFFGRCGVDGCNNTLGPWL